MQPCITCGHDAVTGTKFCRSHIASDSYSPGIGARIEEKLNQYKDGIIREEQLKYEVSLVLGEHQAEPRKMHTEKTRLKYAAKALRKAIAKHKALEKQRAYVQSLGRQLEVIQQTEDAKRGY